MLSFSCKKNAMQCQNVLLFLQSHNVKVDAGNNRCAYKSNNLNCLIRKKPIISLS